MSKSTLCFVAISACISVGRTMATKRVAGEASSMPPAKKLMTQFEPVKIGPIYSLV